MKDETNFFTSDIILENERVLLKPLSLEDIPALSKVAFEPSVWEFGMSNLKNEADLELYIKNALQERTANTSYPFVIFDKKTGSVAGSTRYGNISFANKRLEIGWTWIHPEWPSLKETLFQ